MAKREKIATAKSGISLIEIGTMSSEMEEMMVVMIGDGFRCTCVCVYSVFVSSNNRATNDSVL